MPNEEDFEKEILKQLWEMEDIAEKKTRLYSRLLLDVRLAQDLEEISLRHAQRKQKIERLLFGDTLKKKKGGAEQ